MGAHGKTYDALLRHRLRLAAEAGDMPVPPPPPGARPGEVNAKRQIPAGHPYDPRALKPLTKTLWALSVSLGHILTAHRQFSRLKSISFSPDGLVGGRGYVMTVKDIRSMLFEASDQISAICDTLYDEVNAPHWKSRLAELEDSDVEDVVSLLDDATENLDDPEGEAEEDMEEVEAAPPSKGAKDRFKTVEEGVSNLPTGQDQDPSKSNPFKDKKASEYTYDRRANSSLPVGFLPGGPRVDHLDRGEQTGPGGSYNKDEPAVDDSWAEDTFHGEDHTYPKFGESVMPGAWSDDTPTEAWDFGLGYGARGQGAGGYGEAGPGVGGKGVQGPRAELPGAPSLPVDDGTAERLDRMSQSKLPNDGEKPVARADYYEGFKDNDIDKGAQSELPSLDNSPQTPDLDSPGFGYTYDRMGPRVFWEGTTTQNRPDPIYDRREGPK